MLINCGTRAISRAGKVVGMGLESADVEVVSNAGMVSLAFDTPPSRVDARTNAGSVELAVPDNRYAVSATAGKGRVLVEVVNDPSAARTLTVHSDAGEVRVKSKMPRG